APGEALGALPRPRIIVKQFREMMRDHRGARAGGYHNRLAAFEHVQEIPRHLASLVAIAGVEGGLAAAGLRFGKIQLETEAFEHPAYGHADLRKELVDRAGDEQRDPPGHRQRPRPRRSARYGGRPAS